jgi:hypothetical protein
MNKQQQFDKMVSHLLAQNEKSGEQLGYNASWTCYYRHPEGKLKCAVGALMPDGIYVPGMEGKEASRLMIEHPELKFDIELATDCQIVHDDTEPDQWPVQLMIVATEHGLRYNGVR